MKYLLPLILLASGAWGQTEITITGTVTDASGANPSGTVRVSLRYVAPLSGSTASIAPIDRTYTLTNGVISPTMTLYSNASLSPAGTYYEVRIRPSSGREWVEFWVLASTPTSQAFGAGRTSIVPNPRLMIAPSAITSGGALNGGTLYWNGTAWTVLAAGSSGYYYRMGSGGTPEWSASTTANTVTSPIVLTGLDISCPTCVVTGGSYSNPTWIAALAQSQVTNLVTDLAAKAVGAASSTGLELAVFTSTDGKAIQGIGNLSGILKVTSGVPSVVTAPSGTIVGTSDTQTLTAKTLTLPRFTQYTVATLPTFGTAGRTAYVTDGSAADDCTVGGGATWVQCADTGSAWVHPGGGGGAAGTSWSGAINLGSVEAGRTICGTFSASGATTSTNIAPGWPTLETGLRGVSMYVSASDTITACVLNDSEAAINPASATFRASANGGVAGGSGSMTYPAVGVANSTGSAWGTSYTVGTAANNLVQLTSGGALPAVSAANLTSFPTLNQNTTGTAAGLTSQYIDWSASSGGNSIANKPTLGALAAGSWPGSGVPNSTGSAWGTSYTVGTGANNLVQLNASSQLPAVSAALLTNFPTLNQNTSGTAAGLSATLAVGSGGTGQTAATEDGTLVANGSVFEIKVLPSCSDATTSKLLYNSTTNTFSCGTDQGAGGGLTDPMTTRGDIIYRNSSNVTARLALGANTYFLRSNGTDLSYSAIQAGDVPTLNQSTTGSAATLTTSRSIGGVSFNGSADIVPQTVQVVDSTDASSYVALFDSATGNLQPKTDAGLTYNASDGTLTVTGGIVSGDGTVAGSVAMNELSANGTNHRTFKVPDALTASLTMTFPDTLPSAGDSILLGAPSGGVSAISFGKPAALATPRAIYGNNFDGSAALTQVIASTYGGTGNGFTKFSGPTTAEKTFTLPDASATVLTTNAAVTVAQGGTGAATTSQNYAFIGPTSGSGAPSFRALVAGDVPTLNQNTTGTAANLSGTPALPNGTTATTQSAADNSTKLATTAYVDSGLSGKQATGNYATAAASGSLTTSGAYAVTLTVTGATNVTLPTSGTLLASGSGTADSSVTDASTTAKGKVELAIASEVTTGSSSALAVTPDALRGSDYGKRDIVIEIFGDATDVATGDGKYYLPIPATIAGWNIVGVQLHTGSVNSSSGAVNVDIARCAAVATGIRCSGTVADVLSTNLTVDASEDGSETAAAAAVIDTANDDLPSAGHLRIDVDGAGTGTKGLQIVITVQKP